MEDKLQKMWEQQESFMRLLQTKRDFPKFPLDLNRKQDQKFLKGITHECMHELFEANLLLKNSKDHRVTEVQGFDREDYIEEMSDALHYFFEILILCGVTPDELFQSYMDKGEKNVRRISEGY